MGQWVTYNSWVAHAGINITQRPEGMSIAAAHRTLFGQRRTVNRTSLRHAEEEVISRYLCGNQVTGRELPLNY